MIFMFLHLQIVDSEKVQFAMELATTRKRAEKAEQKVVSFSLVCVCCMSDVAICQIMSCLDLILTLPTVSIPPKIALNMQNTKGPLSRIHSRTSAHSSNDALLVFL